MVPQQPIASTILPPRKKKGIGNQRDSAHVSPHLGQTHQRKSELHIPKYENESQKRVSALEPRQTQAVEHGTHRTLTTRRPVNIPVNKDQSGRHVNDGRSVKLYVRALYDYTASSREEISFMTGDLIAVLRICSDGWWEGEILDETRRIRGILDETRRMRGIFPSNYTEVLKGLGSSPSSTL
ncbi:18791_t:CDS:2 [Acaulospora morrowiae]|uniref:18791_t:CDS:1 n=1 Tax=Acaulospora morrowiae TaxID=94023 RepID=A0A9N8ZDG2_9GLOM|nr:18791_t:CDS:2 [Acaulospora morrowiae]